MASGTRIGIVAALKTEIQPFIESRPVGVDVRISGMGATNAHAAAVELAELKPKLLVSAGFCGAGVDDLRTGDVIVDGDATIEGARRGKILTVPAVLGADEMRRACAEAGAIAVDMEASEVAAVARTRGIPFAAVKVVLDTLDAPLACDYGSTAGVILRPWLWPGVRRDAKRAKIAARALASALSKLSP